MAKKNKPEAIWLKSYPADIPAEIEMPDHASLGAFFEDAMSEKPDLPAHTCMGKTLTYGAWNHQSGALANWLLSLGFEPGARIAIMLPNILQTPIAIAAIIRAGFVLTCVNPVYTPREVKNQLTDSGAKAIIVLENFAHTLEKIIDDTDVEHVCVTNMGDMFDGQIFGLKSAITNLVVRHVKKMVPAWSLPGYTPYREALNKGIERPLSPHSRNQDDIVLLQYTGGTTGVPKAAMITHANILANAEQSKLWIMSGMKGKNAPEQITFVCALPLFHILSLTVNLMIATRILAHNLLIPNPRDIPNMVKELDKTPVHIFGGLNTLFNALLNNEDFRKLDFSQLHVTASGGMKTQAAVANRWKTITGTTIHECYGLSETSPVISGNRFDKDVFTGTIGMPVPSTIVAIRDEKNKDQPPGEIGEICVSGPQVMKGYWNNQSETDNVFTSDNMLKTGDMGFMDHDGLITIVDRQKDMILVSGFNVYPTEIEGVVSSIEGVHECGAIGIPNKQGHEDIKLFVVKKDATLTEDEIRLHCKQELTNYKRPKHIVFVDDLPKSNIGKVLRRELRDL